MYTQWFSVLLVTYSLIVVHFCPSNTLTTQWYIWHCCMLVIAAFMRCISAIIPC